MYASEAIENLFAKVKEEDDAHAGRLGRRKWLWIGVGGTAVAAAVTVWYLASHAEKAPAPTVTDAGL
jgi:hypothetical protein